VAVGAQAFAGASVAAGDGVIHEAVEDGGGECASQVSLGAGGGAGSAAGIVDDLIDATALEREGFAEEQSVPYLAALVRQIYEDAERAFGKDKAKKGYKAAQQQVFGNGNALSPDLAGKLPKV